MDVHLAPELETKLSQMAANQRRPAEALVAEAVERFVDHEEWFLKEVDKGLAAADRGEYVDHDEVRRGIDRRFPRT
jgi:predicted transcriptional regulator